MFSSTRPIEFSNFGSVEKSQASDGGGGGGGAQTGTNLRLQLNGIINQSTGSSLPLSTFSASGDIPYKINNDVLTLTESGTYSITWCFRTRENTGTTHAYVVVNGVNRMLRDRQLNSFSEVLNSSCFKVDAGSTFDFKLFDTSGARNFDINDIEITRLFGFEFNEFIRDSQSPQNNTHNIVAPSVINESNISTTSTGFNLTAGLYLINFELISVNSSSATDKIHAIRLLEGGVEFYYMEEDIGFRNNFANVFTMPLFVPTDALYVCEFQSNLSRLEPGTRIVILKHAS